MMQILVNPTMPELVFPVSRFLLEHSNVFLENNYIITFIEPSKLNNWRKTQDEIDNETEKIIGIRCYHHHRTMIREKNQYALFGIHPKDREEAQELALFFDQNAEDIVLWTDNHQWPSNLLKFMYSQSSNVFIENSKNILDNLRIENIGQEWLEAEEAMRRKNINNSAAARYLKNLFLFNEFREKNDSLEKTFAELFILFSSIVVELVSQVENFGLSSGEHEFDENFKKPSPLAVNFSDNHPIFAEAKRRGRSVGCLILNSVEEYFDAEETLRKGLEKYPWLCVLRFEVGNQAFIKIASRYFPIEEMIKDFVLTQNNFSQFLKRLSVEVLRF